MRLLPMRARRLAATAIVAGWIVGFGGFAPHASAQEAASPLPQPASTETAAKAKHPTRIYVTMWTAHLKDDKPALDNNWVVGGTAYGWFGATFINSYRRRGYAAGLQRSIIETGDGAVRTTLGYRLGFISGYDGRLAKWAQDSPILPLVQPFFVVDFFHVGYEVSYTFVVVSAQVSYRF